MAQGLRFRRPSWKLERQYGSCRRQVETTVILLRFEVAIPRHYRAVTAVAEDSAILSSWIHKIECRMKWKEQTSRILNPSKISKKKDVISRHRSSMLLLLFSVEKDRPGEEPRTTPLFNIHMENNIDSSRLLALHYYIVSLCACMPHPFAYHALLFMTKPKKYVRNKAVLGCLLLALCYTLVSIYWQQRGAPSPTLESLPASILRDTPQRQSKAKATSGRVETTHDLSLQRQEQDNEQQQQQQQQRMYYYPGRKVALQPQSQRPALETLIDEERIIGNVQFLLDFAIIGFGKAGTSTLMDWLAAHPVVAMFAREVYDLVQQRPAHLVQSLYEDLPAGDQYMRGYKNPLEITQPHVLDYYRTYWPQTKLICGLRHPGEFLRLRREEKR
eukprot:scaffold630_cov174-Amphora_coffeaeformis.AAC.17